MKATFNRLHRGMGVGIALAICTWAVQALAEDSFNYLGVLLSVDAPAQVVVGNPMLVKVRAEYAPYDQGSFLFSYWVVTERQPRVTLEKASWKGLNEPAQDGQGYNASVFTFTVPFEHLPSRAGTYSFQVHVRIEETQTWYFGGLPSQPYHSEYEADNSPQTVRFAMLPAPEPPNPFIGVKGTYSGLFYDTNAPSHLNAGSLSLTVTDKGTFSARIQQGISRRSFTGALDHNFAAWLSIAGQGGDNLELALQLTAYSDLVSGTVSSQTWQSQLKAYRVAYSAASTTPPTTPGRYTIILPGAPDDTLGPLGHGFGLLTVNRSGKVSFKGMLSDGSATAQSMPLVCNGEWPCYASLLSGKASIFGWLSIPGTKTVNNTGDLVWSVPAGVGTVCPVGFTNTLVPVGSTYFPPAQGTRILNCTNACVLLEGGDLAASCTNFCLIDEHNKITFTSANLAGLRLSLSPLMGTFQGKFNHPQTGRSTVIRGALLQTQGAGYGFFLAGDQSGSVVLGHQ